MLQLLGNGLLDIVGVLEGLEFGRACKDLANREYLSCILVRLQFGKRGLLSEGVGMASCQEYIVELMSLRNTERMQPSEEPVHQHKSSLLKILINVGDRPEQKMEMRVTDEVPQVRFLHLLQCPKQPLQLLHTPTLSLHHPEQVVNVPLFEPIRYDPVEETH